jgi:hypothetical protein
MRLLKTLQIFKELLMEDNTVSITDGRNPRKNAEGYSDPTAYEAINNVMKEIGTFDAFDRYIISRRQCLFPSGTKIQILKMYDETMSDYNNKIGIVDIVDDLGYVFVKFKDSKKGLRLSGLDEFKKVE